MDAPRSKPFLHWEPLPYLVVIALLLLTGIVRPDSEPWLMWALTGAILASLAWLVVAAFRSRRPANPDRWGDLVTLDGIDIIDAPPVARDVVGVASVIDTARHQAAIELARLMGGDLQHAVLVPGASRWLSLRYRIGVQLVGGGRPRHAGFLDDASSARWVDLLHTARAEGRFVRVPATITGAERPFGVDLDLSGLGTLQS